MKNLVFSILVFASAATAFAQPTEKARSMKNILTEIQPLIDTIEAQNEEIVRMELDIVKDQKETYRQLYDSWTYGITVVGDYRVSKMGLEVYKLQDDGTWQLKKLENAETYFATMTYKPTEVGNFKIVVKAAFQ